MKTSNKTKKQIMLENILFFDEEMNLLDKENTQFFICDEWETAKKKDDNTCIILSCSFNMRIKPKVCTVNGLVIDAPMTEAEYVAIDEDSHVYIVGAHLRFGYYKMDKRECDINRGYVETSRLINRGMVFDTQAKAEAYVKAMGWDV